MKTKEWKIAYAIYDEVEDLPEQDQVLLQLAKKSLEQAYAPYSRFKVGAAVLLLNGKMMPGSNQENAAYPLGVCAEQVALANAAVQFPKVGVEAIAVTVCNTQMHIHQPVPPCGGCRQVICEMENRYRGDIRVILQGESGPIYIFNSGKDLLPLAFDSSFL